MMMEVMNQAAFTSKRFTDCISRSVRLCFLALTHTTYFEEASG
jgi:hypothetical protein